MRANETSRSGKLNWDPTEHYKSSTVAQSYEDERFRSLPGRVFNSREKKCVADAIADLPPNSLILDAPCGTGRLAEVLLERGHRVVGLDISSQMLEVAKIRLARFGPRFQTRVGDATELVSGEDEFAAALCARVLMHFPLSEQIKFLRGVARATDGKVIFNQSLNTPYQRARRAAKRMLRNQEPAGYPISTDESQQLIHGAGLKLVSRRAVMPLVSEAYFFICEHQRK